jgi:lipopolysaccharide export LptBFGC system permease protein LptF
MLAEIFFYAIVIYLVYKIIFDFIVPVSNAGRQMKQQFKNVNEHFNKQQQNAQQNNNQPKSKKVVGDYIDFEEVKK